MSRFILTPALFCALAGTIPAAENADHKPAHKPTTTVATTNAESTKAANTIDPISGKPVDSHLTPVPMAATINNKAVSIAIAVASADDAAILKKASTTDKALYIQAAQANGMVKDGKIVPIMPPKS